MRSLRDLGCVVATGDRGRAVVGEPVPPPAVDEPARCNRPSTALVLRWVRMVVQVWDPARTASALR